jgi:hypothetical protein
MPVEFAVAVQMSDGRLIPRFGCFHAHPAFPATFVGGGAGVFFAFIVGVHADRIADVEDNLPRVFGVSAIGALAILRAGPGGSAV